MRTRSVYSALTRSLLSGPEVARQLVESKLVRSVSAHVLALSSYDPMCAIEHRSATLLGCGTALRTWVPWVGNRSFDSMQ